MGSPSVPEVNRIAAGLEGSGLAASRRERELAGGAGQLVPQRQGFADILEIDDFRAQAVDQGLQACHFHQAPGGDHPLHLRGGQRAFQSGEPAGEIQHGGNAAVSRQGKKAQRRRRPGGQHHADAFARAGAALQRRAQGKTGADDFVIGESALVAIDQGDRARAMVAPCLCQRFKHGTPRVCRIEWSARGRSQPRHESLPEDSESLFTSSGVKMPDPALEAANQPFPAAGRGGGE